jgi:hypothetical protein
MTAVPPGGSLVRWLALAGALAACGGESSTRGTPAPRSPCEIPGARTAELPLEIAKFELNDAFGVTPHALYLAESAGTARVARVSPLGGTPEVLGSDLFYVVFRTLGTDTYFVTQGFAGRDSALYRIPDGGGLSKLDADLKGASDLAVTSTHLFVADGYTGTVYRYSRSGGDRTVIAENAGTPLLATDGTAVYYLATDSAGSSLYRVEADGTSTLVWGGFGPATRLLLFDGIVYAAGASISAYDLNRSLELQVSTTPAYIQEIVRFGDDFYYTDGSDHGRLLRVPVAGGTPTLLDDQLGWGGLATDGISIFYGGNEDVRVYCPPIPVAP